MGLVFAPITTASQIEELAERAAAIWGEYWPDRIGLAQTAYMVERFQSVEAITRDIAEHGYRYWLVYADDGRCVGYTGGAGEQMTGEEAHDQGIHHSDVVDSRWPRRFFISKIYLYAHERGKHFASRIIEFYEQLCRDEGFPVMYLTVNRHNDLAVRAYLGRGFVAVDEVVADIGNGFVMDDYIMAREIAASCGS